MPKRKSQLPTITFLGGLQEPVHRWFRLTPSYSPTLVSSWLEKTRATRKSRVLDPFLGAGTSCIVAKGLGIPSEGYEINPLLAFVARVSTDWSIDSDELLAEGREVVKRARTLVSSAGSDPEALVDALGDTLPPLHNIERWWRPEVLSQMLALRHHAEQCAGLKDHLLLCLAAIVYDSANITLGRLQVAFVDRTGQNIDAFGLFSSALERMAEDLRSVPKTRIAPKIHHGDSRAVASTKDDTITHLFTSPPYPTRYSYVWNTRPHLYLLRFIDVASEASRLDLDTIGGTWGTATTALQRGTVELRPAVNDAIGPVIEKLHISSTLMGNYVTKYFNDLDVHLTAVRPKLREGARVGYVVGNSETKGIMVETHLVLRDLLEAHGFGDLAIDVLRTRNSGVGLVEAVVEGSV